MMRNKNSTDFVEGFGKAVGKETIDMIKKDQRLFLIKSNVLVKFIFIDI